MFVLPNGQSVRPGNAFGSGGTQYPENWLQFSTDQEKLAIGLVEVADPPPVDWRFYSAADKPLPLARCKSVHTTAVKDYVALALSATDWKVVRASEGYKACDANTLAYRAAVRDRGNELASEVNALAAVEDVIAWQAHDWPSIT
jgi:hypothetical protein